MLRKGSLVTPAVFWILAEYVIDPWAVFWIWSWVDGGSSMKS